MTITYNDTYVDIYNAYYYDDSTGTYTTRGADGHNIDYFDDDSIAGDAIIFTARNSEAGKFNEISFNVATQLVASAISVIWEYPERGASHNVPTWHALADVVDDTNAFQNAGANVVSFTCPENWQNNLNPGGACDGYGWDIRCRIVSTTGLTEGGKQTADAIRVKPNTIWVSGFSEGTPCTLEDIYDEDVLQSWGVVTKTGNNYTFNCNLYTESSTGYFTTKQEVIQFLKNWDCWFYGVIKSGEVVSGSKCRYGSEFLFNLYNGSLKGFLAYTDAEIYNTHYRYIKMTGSTANFGHWGGGLGAFSGQKIIDIYAEGMRQFKFNNSSNAIMGAKGYDIRIENPGAILKNITCYGGTFSARLNISNKEDFIHDSDFSGVTTTPLSAYTATKVEDFEFTAVDCNWGTYEDTNKVQWKTTITDDYYQGWIWETNSFLFKVLDANNNAISGVTVVLENTDEEVFNYVTSAEGYVGQDTGSISSATASTMVDSSKSWTTDQWWFQEVYITAGEGIGQRRIIKKGNTSTELEVAPDWDVTPDNTSKYIIIPYVNVKKMSSPVTEPATGYHWSLATDYNPFTLTVAKAGYQTYKKKFTIDKKIDWTATLKRISINIDNEVIC